MTNTNVAPDNADERLEKAKTQYLAEKEEEEEVSDHKLELKLFLKEAPKDITCLLEGGSILYGLNNANSDVDYRGIYALSDLNKILGLEIYGARPWENFVMNTDEVDAGLYDMRKFMYLLSKTNTQVIEILYALERDFIVLDGEFKFLMKRRTELIDTDKFYLSLRGYILKENRLMNGERTGNLGSKRISALDKYGYSYKNLVQIIRLAFCGETLFTKGYYPVNIKRESDDMHKFLMTVKDTPELYNTAQANTIVDDVVKSLDTAYANRQYQYQFNVELANDFLSDFYVNKVKSLVDSE